jgi:scaffold protein (connect acetoacetyl-CoA thiolase and HMG-CoA synthase)
MEPTAPVAPPGLWRTTDGVTTLLGGRSRSTGLLHFPRSPVCPYRGTDDVDDVELARTGVLWACTTVQTAPPGYTGPIPYHLGVVELDPDPDGQVLRVVGRIEGGATAGPAVGDRMEVVEVDVATDEGGITVWGFAPTAAGGAA